METTRLLPARRRGLRSAAAQEELRADLGFIARLLVIATCIGLGLAIGVHWDEILADVRLAAFTAEEPRWLWQIVDSL